MLIEEPFHIKKKYGYVKTNLNFVCNYRFIKKTKVRIKPIYSLIQTHKFAPIDVTSSSNVHIESSLLCPKKGKGTLT